MKSSAAVGFQSVVLAVATISGASPSVAGAQTVEGRIVDETGELPLRLVTVSLLRVGEGTVVSAMSDSLGIYRITVPEPGEYQVVADAVGYQRLQTPLLALEAGRSYHVDFELPSDPIELEGLEVEVESLEKMRRELRMYGVVLDALGERFVDAQAIARRRTARDFGSVLQWQNIPGMSVIRSDDIVPQPPDPSSVSGLWQGDEAVRSSY